MLKIIRRLGCILGLAAFYANAHADEVPSEPTAFTEYVAQQMKRELADTPVAVKEPLTLSVGTLQANLDRIFGYCKANPQGCAAGVSRYIQGAAQVLKEQNTPLERNAIRIVVRSAAYLKRAQDSLGPDGPILQYKPLAEGLVILPVLETPRAVRPLDDRDLKSLNLSLEQLIELGGANLSASIKPVSDLAKPVGSGQIGTLKGSVFYPGLIAFPARWNELAKAQGGQLLVALPTTDTVLYVSESSSVATDALRALAKEMMAKASNPLSATTLKWTESGWELVP